MKLPLSELQQNVYDFIQDYIKNQGYPPLYRDIQSQLNIKNVGSIHKAIAALERKGWLGREKGTHRGIVIKETGGQI